MEKRKNVKRIADLLKHQGFEVDNFTDASTGRYVFHYGELGDLEQLDAMNFLRSEKAMKALVRANLPELCTGAGIALSFEMYQ